MDALNEKEDQYFDEQIKKLNSVPVEVEQNTFTLAELWSKKDDVQKFVIPELIPDSSLAVLIGEDGIGKTQIMTQLCLSICLHFSTFLTLKLNVRHARCLIVATEDSKEKFTQAIVKQAQTIKPDLNPGTVHIHFTEGSNFDLLDDLLIEIKRCLKLNNYDLIVIDALSDLFTMIDGEINSNSHARKILNKLQMVCNTYGTSIVIIHHAAKSKITELQKEGNIFLNKNTSQGAGAITQKPRTILALSTDPKSISEDGKFYTNYLHVVKANLMGKEYVTNALSLEFNGNNLIHTFREITNIELWNRDNTPDGEANVQQENGRKRKAGPKEIEPDLHVAFMDFAFANGETYSRKDMIYKMVDHYGVGQNKITSKDGFLEYLLSSNLVEKTNDVYYKYGSAPF